MGRTILAVILGIIAVLFIVAAIIYLAEPANSLTILPGHIAGSTGHHPLRATGCFVVGVVFAVGAWFTLVYKPKAGHVTERRGKLARGAELTDSRFAPIQRPPPILAALPRATWADRLRAFVGNVARRNGGRVLQAAPERLG